MQPFGKRRVTTGAVALTIGIAAMGGCLVTASSAVAAAPGGVACSPTDGKITGRGSTYQTNAQKAWLASYNSEICGATNESPADAAGANMGVYNGSYTTSTGSGAGLIGANCRTDAYWGTDLPYSEAQLTSLDGTPGLNVNSLGPCPTVSALASPFAPDAATNSVYPSTSDQAGNVMSFPVAGSSESLRVNLTAAECGGTRPTAINLTGAQVSAILGGSVLTWNSSALTSNNASLAGCNVPIVRVVRFDNSGTTSILKQYLNDVDNSRSTATCAPGTTWSSYQTSPNTTWPGGSTATSTCSAYINAGSNGGPALLTLLDSTAGGIGYADLSDAVNDAATNIQVSVQNAAGTQYVSPQNGLSANCNLSSVSAPDNAAPTGIVGLDSSNNWGSDNSAVNGTGTHSDANDTGTAYPICGLTFDLVFAGEDSTTGSPTAALTADQRRTLYSYFTFVLSSLGQSQLPNEYYTALPGAWQTNVLSGFQSNF